MANSQKKLDEMYDVQNAAQQAQQKAGAAPQGAAPMEGGPEAASVPSGISPENMPLASSNPPIGVASSMEGVPEAERAAQQADIMSRQN